MGRRPHLAIALGAAALVLSVPMSTCNYPCAPIDPSCPKDHATVQTGGATVSGTAATLTGTVNPNGSPTTAWFEWSTLSNLGSLDRKSTRLNSSHLVISYAVFCLKKKKNNTQ